MSRVLRPRSSVDYGSERTQDSVLTVGSASSWGEETIQHMNIKVIDIADAADVNTMFPFMGLHGKASDLLLKEWTDKTWLTDANIKQCNDDDIKTLLDKIMAVFTESVTELHVDGFMNSLLYFLGFDKYPCHLYPQYRYSANIGQNNRCINAKPDFGVTTKANNNIMLIIEDKTIKSATYPNNWKESQVLGELFVAVHHVVANAKAEVKYPVNVYAVRVIGTKFTFYRTVAALEYIRETAKLGMSTNSEMKVQRHPPVEDDPSKLTAYDICNVYDRKCILECLCSIRTLLV